jgi:hypothetical protein
VVIAEQTEKDIDETRSQYIPVAVRTRILFFCTYDLVSFGAVVDVLLHISLHSRNFTGKYRPYVPIFSGMVYQHFPQQHRKCRASR